MHVLTCLQVVVALVAVLACCVDARKTEDKPQEMLWRDEKEVPKSCWMYYTEVNILISNVRIQLNTCLYYLYLYYFIIYIVITIIMIIIIIFTVIINPYY